MTISKIAIVASLFLAGITASALPTSHALSDFENERLAATTKFLKLANDPRSPLGKQIATINRETQDGRNPEGTIALPLTENSIQVVIESAEFIYGMWHYAQKIGKVCTASDSERVIRIFLTGIQNVRSATGYDVYQFQMKTGTHARFETNQEHCESAFFDDDYKNYQTVLSISEPIEIK